jgi:hypothetical protein
LDASFLSRCRAMQLEHCRGFAPLLLGVVIAVSLAFLLKETGSAVHISEARQEI